MISVRMYGGLGNQLFQYFAAKHVQNVVHCELEFDFVEVEIGSGHPLSDIRDFKFFTHETIRNVPKAGSFHRLSSRVRNKLARNSSFFSEAFKIDAPGNHEPNMVSQVKDGWRLEGYYQKFDYYYEFRKRNPDFTWDLRNRNLDFETILNKYKKNNNLGIHIRGGDYLSRTSLYESMDANYYQHSIAHLSRNSNFSDIMLFTNDVIFAENLLGKIHGLAYQIAPELRASETLLLLSSSKGLVTSNSTFSAWAAIIASRGIEVVSPVNWYKNPKMVQPQISGAKLI